MLHFLSPTRLRNCEINKTLIPPRPTAAVHSTRPARRFRAGVLLAALALSACSEAPSASSPETPPIQEVSVIELQPSPLAVIRELPGRIAPTRIAEVRARVSGIIDRRNFEQGSDVKKGEVLYEIDAKPFQIELDAAEAALSKANAVLDQESQNEKRKEALAPSGAISPAQLEMAIAAFRQAEADVAAREADVARARLNLEYTRIRAPISGRIGRALVTEGALVGQSEPTHVATIQQLDPDLRRFHPIGHRAEASCGANSRPARLSTARRRGCALSSTTARSMPTTASCCSPTPRSIPAPVR